MFLHDLHIKRFDDTNTMFLVFLCLIVSCRGLLLDGITNYPQTGNGFSDAHFNMLLNLLLEERQARGNIEKIVSQLQKELQNTKYEFTNTFCKCNSNADIIEIENKTEYLENQLHTLQTDHINLQMRYQILERKLSNTEAKAGNLEQEVGQIKQLKSVSDLQSVLQLQNFTKHLEHELQTTNGKLSNVIAKGNARSQDFLALINNLKKTDNKTASVQKDVESLQFDLNFTATQINQMSNRAALTVQAIEGDVSANSVIPLKTVHTSYGITDLSSVRNDGKFTCEKDGLYLISSFVATTSKLGGYYYIYKNNDYIAAGYRHTHDFALTSTLIVLERLRTGDMVYVGTGEGMHVLGGFRTCLTVLQVE